MINILIFSKDRAMQLNLLMQSIDDHLKDIPKEIYILNLYTSPAYLAGYEKFYKKWRRSYHLYIIGFCQYQQPLSLSFHSCHRLS